MVILVKRKPLSRQQFLALRQRILRKHSSSAASTINDTSESEDLANQNDDKTDSSATPTKEISQKQQDNTHLLQEQEEKRKKLREERNEISRQLASLESKLASLKEEKHHLFQQLKQALHEDEQKRQLQHDQKIREQQQQQAAIEATPTNLPLQQQQQPQPLLPQLQDQHQKQQQQQASRPPPDQQQKLVSMPTGIKRPRNDSDELAGSHDYMSSQPHKRPPLLSNPPMMSYHPQGFPQQQQQQQQQQQPNFNNASFSKANNFQGFEPHPQQPFHAVDMSYQQPRFPLPEPNHMIASQSDQRFVFQARPPLNNEMSENYRPQFTNQMHHGGQQMEFGNQGYGQEFSSQQPHLMGYAGGRAGYKHSLLEHTTTGPTSNCSSPSSLHSPITNLSMPTSVAGAPFSPHEPSPVFQMGVAPAPPFSHEQQKTSSKQPRNNPL